MPVGIPSLGCGEGGNYSVQNSSTVIQHRCENSRAMRPPWGQDPLQLDSSALSPFCQVRSHPAPVLLPCSALHSAPVLNLQCFSSRLGKTVFSGKGKWSLRARGELTYKDKSPGSWCLISLFSCK